MTTTWAEQDEIFERAAMALHARMNLARAARVAAQAVGKSEQEAEKVEAAVLASEARAFLQSTDARWRFLGVRLHRRWRRKLPDWVEVADIEQELRRLAIKYVAKWDAGRGEIGQYVVWSAVHRAQREMHVWRGAKLSGNEGRNPSRNEVTVSRLLAAGWERNRVERAFDASRELQAPDGQLQDEEAFMAILASARTIAEAAVLRALRAGGSVARAAELLTETFEARAECGVSDEEEARTLITGIVRKLARELMPEEKSAPKKRRRLRSAYLPPGIFGGVRVTKTMVAAKRAA